VAGALMRIPDNDSPMKALLSDPVSILMIAVIGTTLAPVCEEIVFRGFLQPLLVRSFGAAPGILLAAAAFGLMHLQEYGYSWRHALLIGLAGASFGWGVLPESAAHEVRDRDYFFVLGFWVWGAWAGVGATALARRAGAQWIPVGVLAAAAPLVLNAPAADRRAEPERSIALVVAHALLSSAPPRAVLFTGGDNDSFPAWYAQAVEGMRPDVTIVVAPLLGTEWYRAQLARRDSLVAQADIAPTRTSAMMVAAVAREARARHRPLAASLMTSAATRDAVGTLTIARGMVFVEQASAPDVVRLGGDAPSVDTAAAAAITRDYPLARLRGEDATDEGIDTAPASFLAYLQCPSRYLAIARGRIAAASLDSVCKLR